MYENLKKDVSKVESGIKSLRRSLHFVLNNYDYHHKNDEQAILQNKKKILNQVSADCYEVKTDFNAFKQLMRDTWNKASSIDDKIEEIVQNFQLNPSVIVNSSSLVHSAPSNKIEKVRNVHSL